MNIIVLQVLTCAGYEFNLFKNFIVCNHTHIIMALIIKYL